MKGKMYFIFSVIDDEEIPSNISLTQDVIDGEMTIIWEPKSVIFACSSNEIRAKYLFTEIDLDIMSKSPYNEKYFTPGQCKMAASIRYEDDENAYIKSEVSCNTPSFPLSENYFPFYLGGYIIRGEKEFERIYSIVYFNPVYTQTNGSVEVRFSVRKESLKTDTYLLTYIMSVEDPDLHSPLSRQIFEYDDQKSFTGHESYIVNGTLVLYGGDTGNVTRATQGSMTKIKCAAVGNPLPNLIMMKGNKEILGLVETVSRGFIKNMVS